MYTYNETRAAILYSGGQLLQRRLKSISSIRTVISPMLWSHRTDSNPDHIPKMHYFTRGVALAALYGSVLATAVPTTPPQLRARQDIAGNDTALPPSTSTGGGPG